MELLIESIVEGDLSGARHALKAEPALANAVFDEAALHDEFAHWIYVGDTALHVAAAGHRVQIASALLAAGANPNAAGNHRQSTALHYASDGYSIF